jgi:hypothetical protein
MAILAVEAMLAGRRVLEAAPTADQTDAFWTACVTALAEPIAAGIVRKNETNRTLELPTGARIRSKTAYNADTLRGDYADLLILDEYSLMDEDAWKLVGAPMLLDNNGDACFIFTPKSMNHAYTLYQRAMGDDTGRWAVFHFTSLDNPHLSKEALAEITQDMTADAYRQEVLAEFLQGSGAVFRNLDACLIAPPTTPAAHRDHLIVGGIDWGRVDFTVLSLYCCNCGYEVFLDRFNTIGWSLQRDRFLAALKLWRAKYVRVEKNSIGGPNLEALQDAAPREISLVGFDMTPKSKPQLIQRLALAFETQSAWWLPDPIAKHELLAFESKTTETGYVKYSAPEGGNDDTVVARALAWRTAEANMPVGFTEDEKREHWLPPNLRKEAVEQGGSDLARFMRAVKLEDRKREQQRDEIDNWTASIMEIEKDDVWRDAYKDPDW